MNKKTKKGISLSDIQLLSNTIYSTVESFIDHAHGFDYKTICMLEVMKQIKVKCDRKLASGIYREYYSLKLTEAEIAACMAFNKGLNNKGMIEAHNAVTRLLSINLKK